MEKVIRDNKVAILISHGWGVGWYSWNKEYPELLFHPKLVEMVEQDRRDEITTEWVSKNLGIEDLYCIGAKSLQIHWLPVGTAFIVTEYEGDEKLLTLEELVMTA